MTTPSCVSASSSALLWPDDSNAHDSGKQLFCHSSNPLRYISTPISARSFNIDPPPASTTSPLQVFTSACCLLYWTCYSQYSRLCTWRYCSQRSRHCHQVHCQFHRNILVVVIYIATFCCRRHRITDACCGIATYRTPTHCAHSRGILILAMRYGDPTQEAY